MCDWCFNKNEYLFLIFIRFNVDLLIGFVILVQILDYENILVYQLLFRVQDNGIFSREVLVSLIIIVLDYNDFGFIFNFFFYQILVNEGEINILILVIVKVIIDSENRV